MLTNQQEQYLNAMGVVVWRLRQLKFCYCYHLQIQNSSASPIAVVLAEASLDPQRREQEESLLIAICKALGKPFQASKSVIAASQDMIATIQRFPVAILLGEKIAQQCLQSEKNLNQLRSRAHLIATTQVYVTDALGAMLANPKLKGPVWRDLRACLQIR